jgi:hypothetical protein
LYSLVVFLNFESFAAFRVLTYDEIRSEGGFNSPSMFFVSRIIPSGNKLSGEEIEQLISSKTLKNLHTLDLSEQENISDEVIRQLSENETFKRIINLDLSNTPVTNVSIKHLIAGNIGSIRDLPQISSKFDVPAITIYLTALYTNIQSEKFSKDFEKDFFGGGNCFTFYSKEEFHVDYINPITDEKTSDPVDNAMKMIEVTL